MHILKPIETVYKGYRFRSRLEARWAVFFDALELEWEYEKEGFELERGKYLPDFWISTVNMWAEVKPEQAFNRTATALVEQLSVHTGYPVLMLGGVPANRPYIAACSGDFHEFCLTNYNNYPQREHRFYGCPADYEREWNDTEEACIAARSARFEHGEHGRRYGHQERPLAI